LVTVEAPVGERIDSLVLCPPTVCGANGDVLCRKLTLCFKQAPILQCETISKRTVDPKEDPEIADREDEMSTARNVVAAIKVMHVIS